MFTNPKHSVLSQPLRDAVCVRRCQIYTKAPINTPLTINCSLFYTNYGHPRSWTALKTFVTHDIQLWTYTLGRIR